MTEDLLAESHVRALLAQSRDRARADLCGEEPHGVRPDVDHAYAHLAKSDLGIGRSLGADERRYRSRPRAIAARRERSPYAALQVRLMAVHSLPLVR